VKPGGSFPGGRLFLPITVADLAALLQSSALQPTDLLCAVEATGNLAIIREIISGEFAQIGWLDIRPINGEHRGRVEFYDEYMDRLAQ
jgi:hypothetical protein